jgi:outer membrane protein assembly factor BamB
MRRQMNCYSALATIVCVALEVAGAQVNVITYHNDNARTGQNTQEATLTISNVAYTTFGKLFSVPVDGKVYAQPLILTNVSIGGGTHNVVYVATEHDSVYAIDAGNGTVYWHTSFINPSAGITAVSSGDINCPDVGPEYGITSTPVIDPSTGTIYVVAKTKENGSYFVRLHALNAGMGAEKIKIGGAVITGTAGGRSFDPKQQETRPALLLENGHVIIASGSHCDSATYYGWVFSYSASTLAQEAIFNAAPNGTGGLNAGIWMSGAGVASDASGNLYFATGNGTYDENTSTPVDFGDSIVKLNPPSGGVFSVPPDWFTPLDQEHLQSCDLDLGSGGVLLLPDLPAGFAHRHLLVQAAKEGTIYLVDRDNMGKHCEGCTQDNIVQELSQVLSGTWGMPAYWNGYVYFGTADHSQQCLGNVSYPIKSYSFNVGGSGVLSSSPVSSTPVGFSWPGPTPTISASGNSNGILWLLDNSSSGSSCCQVLHAYNAANLSNELYSSSSAPWNIDVPGGSVKFAVPTVANGKVYVGTQNSVVVYGNMVRPPQAAAPYFSPTPQKCYWPSPSIYAYSNTPNAVIHCTINGSPATPNSPVCNNPVVNNAVSNYTISTVATASGDYASNVSTAVYTVCP